MNTGQIVRIPLLAIAVSLLAFPAPPSSFTSAGAETFAPQAHTGKSAAGMLVPIGRNQGTFLILSDIHFDPFADPALVSRLAAEPLSAWLSIFQSSANHSLSRESRDSSYWLIASALDSARSSGVPYDYVLVTGDYLAHDFRAKYDAHNLPEKNFQSFAINTMVFVSRMVQSSFPKLSIIGVLGNNDSSCDDYAEPPRSALLSALASEWTAVATHSEATKDFSKGGFYAIPHPTIAGQELIVLNSTLWSPRFHPRCLPAAQHSGPSTDAGTEQMDWLRKQLDQTQHAGKTAVLIMHIPPGIDAFSSATRGDCASPSSFWKSEYLDAFLALMKRYRPILRDTYAGHLHRDDFRILSDDGTPFLQMHIAPSISPIYLNNPAFEIGLYDKPSGALADYTVVYLKNYTNADKTEPPAWSKEYAFGQAYHVSRISPATVDGVAAAIRSRPEVRTRFLDFYSVDDPVVSVVATKDWPLYSCAQTQIRTSDFIRCACPSPAATIPQN